MERAQEPVEESTGTAPDAAMRKVTTKYTVRRSPSGKLLVAGLLVPALMAGAAGFLAGPAAEDSLVADATVALEADRLKDVRLQADGPFVTAMVPTRVDAAQVEGVVAEVEGVSDVVTKEVYSSKKEAQACSNLGRELDQVTDKQRIPFSGESARLTASGQRMVLAAAKLVSACGSAEVYVGGHTDPSTRDGSTLTLLRARAMIAVMRRAGTPEERLTPRGYGAQYPVAEGDSRSARASNQRGSITLAAG